MVNMRIMVMDMTMRNSLRITVRKRMISIMVKKTKVRNIFFYRVMDSSIFFPMNWTFQLNCDRIRWISNERKNGKKQRMEKEEDKRHDLCCSGPTTASSTR